MKVDLNLTPEEKLAIRQNSIERVINTSVRLVEEIDGDLSETNLLDWQALKPIVVKLWEAAREASLKEMVGSE